MKIFRLNSKAQVTIELTAAFIGCILLLAAIVKIFAWINQSIIDRQVNYQNSRLTPTTEFNYNVEELELVK